MIKGEIQITDAAVSLQPLPLHKNLEKSLSEEAIIKDTRIEEIRVSDLEIKIHFARLKKRRCCRSSNIL